VQRYVEGLLRAGLPEHSGAARPTGATLIAA
jgi:hypothetical protein